MIQVAEITRLPIFEVLSPDETALFLPKIQYSVHPKNTVVFAAQSPADRIYLLLSGYIKTGIILPDEKEVAKQLVQPGDFLGIGTIMNHPVHEEFAKTLSVEAKVLSVSKADFTTLMARNPRFLQAVLQMAGKTLARSEARLEMLLTSDVRTRLDTFLKEHKRHHSDFNGLETLLSFGLTQQDIAHMIGATRQTVALILQEQRKARLNVPPADARHRVSV